jgi:hypothetical protein
MLAAKLDHVALTRSGEQQQTQREVRFRTDWAAKARGVRLGRNGADRLVPINKAAALDRASGLKPVLSALSRVGMSARQIAAELAARAVPTARGGRWHQQTVIRMLDRLPASAE